MRKLLFLLTLTTFFTRSYALTWNEPWADKVIKGASSFVLAKVVSTDPEKGIFIKLIKTISGKKLEDSLTITGFYLLEICSSSGHGPEFHLPPMDSCYFFIQQDEKGKYCIATPTTGFDYVFEGKVASTYRHSYHKANVPVAIYENTMTAIFNNYHSLPYDHQYINNFVHEYLGKAPAPLEESELNTFFLQHVALECIYHLKLQVKESIVSPFLQFRENFHHQVSAARAMVSFNTESNKQTLLQFINDTTQKSFVQVMCVWSLAELKPKALKTQLQQAESKASEENDGFGGNIMDPRVCTNIPPVKDALKTLLATL